MKYTGSIFKRSRRYGLSLLGDNKEFLKGKKRTTVKEYLNGVKNKNELLGKSFK